MARGCVACRVTDLVCIGPAKTSRVVMNL